MELLIALDIQTDIDFYEKMLEIYFKHLNKEKLSDGSNETKCNPLVDEFRHKNLAKGRVFWEALNVENVFLWRYLCEFCQTNQIEIQDFIANENSDQNPDVIQIEEHINGEIPVDIITEEILSSEQASDEPKVQKVDLFELLVPDIPYFCAYLEKWALIKYYFLLNF